MAQIPSCCGCGVGRRLQLRLDPLAWEPPYAMGAALEKAKSCHFRGIKTHSIANINALPTTYGKKKKKRMESLGLPIMAQWLTNPTSIHEDLGSVPGLAQ